MGSQSLADFLASLLPPFDLRSRAEPFGNVVKRIREDVKLAAAAGIFPTDTVISVRKTSYGSIYVQITEWHGGAVFSPEYELTIRDPSSTRMDSSRRCRFSPELARVLADLELVANRHNYDRSRSEVDHFDVGYYLTVDAKPIEGAAVHAIRLEHDAAFAALVARARVAAAVVGPKALASVCRQGFDAAGEWELTRLIKMAARANGAPLVHDKRRGWIPAPSLAEVK